MNSNLITTKKLENTLIFLHFNTLLVLNLDAKPIDARVICICIKI